MTRSSADFVSAWSRWLPPALVATFCHFAGQDEKGRWGLVGHDVEEFRAIVRRHGAWTADLELFATEIKQLTLDFKPRA